MTPQPSLESFIPLVLQGDRAATVQFGERIGGFVWNCLHNWRFSDSEKRDLVATCVTTVMLKLSTFKGTGLKAWVKTIAFRIACDHYAETTGQSLDSMDADGYIPGKEVDLFCACPYPEAQAAVHRAMEKLHPVDVVILEGRYGDVQLEFKELAEALHMKCNAVIKRHARALEALRRLLDDDPDIRQWKSRQ